MDGFIDCFKLEASSKKEPFGIASCKAAYEVAHETMPNRALLFLDTFGYLPLFNANCLVICHVNPLSTASFLIYNPSKIIECIYLWTEGVSSFMERTLD